MKITGMTLSVAITGQTQAYESLRLSAQATLEATEDMPADAKTLSRISMRVFNNLAVALDDAARPILVGSGRLKSDQSFYGDVELVAEPLPTGRSSEGVKVTSIEASHGQKWALRPYENLDVAQTVWADLEPGEDPDEALMKLQTLVADTVRTDAYPILKECGRIQSRKQFRPTRTLKVGDETEVDSRPLDFQVGARITFDADFC